MARKNFAPEFWPIEKEQKHLNMLWIIYDLNINRKNPFEQRLAHFRIFLDPGIDIIGQFLGSETKSQTIIYVTQYYSDIFLSLKFTVYLEL